MKKALLTLAMVGALSTPALADGFICSAIDHDLNVKVYNHTSPKMGTRNAAVMILSNPTVGQGRRTIAIFRDVSNTLSNEGSNYLAKVDLRFNDSGRKGEFVAGTRLGEIATIDLSVDHVYGDNFEKGSLTTALAVISLRNGETIVADLDCERYLAQ